MNASDSVAFTLRIEIVGVALVLTRLAIINHFVHTATATAFIDEFERSYLFAIKNSLPQRTVVNFSNEKCFVFNLHRTRNRLPFTVFFVHPFQQQ